MKKLFLSVAVLMGALNAHAATVTTVTPAQLKAEIAKNKGKAVLVNFWATWCAPCVKELPALAQLQKNNPQKLKVILVSADDPAAVASVKKTLASKGQASSRLIKGDMVAFFDAFDPKFKGAVALPRTYLWDKKGQQVVGTGGEHTLAQLQKMVAPHL